MDTFTVKIDTGNEAFADDPTPELARILRAIAAQIEQESYLQFRTIFDINGNDVGRFALNETLREFPGIYQECRDPESCIPWDSHPKSDNYR